MKNRAGLGGTHSNMGISACQHLELVDITCDG